MNKQVLDYTKKKINSNFRIKVAGVDANGNKINMLVGVAGAIEFIGVELFNKFVRRAFECMSDACICKLRRGLKVTFYAK